MIQALLCPGSTRASIPAIHVRPQPETQHKRYLLGTPLCFEPSSARGDQAPKNTRHPQPHKQNRGQLVVLRVARPRIILYLRDFIILRVFTRGSREQLGRRRPQRLHRLLCGVLRGLHCDGMPLRNPTLVFHGTTSTKVPKLQIFPEEMYDLAWTRSHEGSAVPCTP